MPTPLCGAQQVPYSRDFRLPPRQPHSTWSHLLGTAVLKCKRREAFARANYRVIAVAGGQKVPIPTPGKKGIALLGHRLPFEAVVERGRIRVDVHSSTVGALGLFLILAGGSVVDISGGGTHVYSSKTTYIFGKLQPFKCKPTTVAAARATTHPTLLDYPGSCVAVPSDEATVTLLLYNSRERCFMCPTCREQGSLGDVLHHVGVHLTAPSAYWITHNAIFAGRDCRLSHAYALGWRGNFLRCSLRRDAQVAWELEPRINARTLNAKLRKVLWQERQLNRTTVLPYYAFSWSTRMSQGHARR